MGKEADIAGISRDPALMLDHSRRALTRLLQFGRVDAA
jgi:hypothetical protein